MDLSAEVVPLEDILPWREAYRSEMNCQIIHDSIHERPGWTFEYQLLAEGAGVGYGSVAVGGPWKRKATAYEFYVVPEQRAHLFALFDVFLHASRPRFIESQTNDVLTTAMQLTVAHRIRSEAILFHDTLKTSLQPAGARFRAPVANELPGVDGDRLRWHGVVELSGKVVGSGGILFHYNRPYGDIFMDVSKAYRRRGLGSFLVQELKRVCYEGGHVPAARCRPGNVASWRTLQKAGLVPCGHLLKGSVKGTTK